jgi:hypothetical protein
MKKEIANRKDITCFLKALAQDQRQGSSDRTPS